MERIMASLLPGTLQYDFAVAIITRNLLGVGPIASAVKLELFNCFSPFILVDAILNRFDVNILDTAIR